MTDTPRKMQDELRQHASEAWEDEVRAALGALAERFDAWRAGKLSSADLDAAIDEYCVGPAREMWKRLSTHDRIAPLAHAVAVGLITEASLPVDVRVHIASMVAFFKAREHGS